MSCHECCNERAIGGNVHIKCVNPPIATGELPNGSEEMREKAKHAIEEIKKLHPDTPLILRCIWGGSGIFPLNFDANTVLGCSNFNVPPKEEPKNDPLLDMFSILAGVNRL